MLSLCIYHKKYLQISSSFFIISFCTLLCFLCMCQLEVDLSYHITPDGLPDIAYDLCSTLMEVVLNAGGEQMVSALNISANGSCPALTYVPEVLVETQRGPTCPEGRKLFLQDDDNVCSEFDNLKLSGMVQWVGRPSDDKLL